MNSDYENFVQRMGSFEDEIELDEDPEELTHSLLNRLGSVLLKEFIAKEERICGNIIKYNQKN